MSENEDDDWFERALRGESAGEEAPEEAEEPDETEVSDEAESAPGGGEEAEEPESSASAVEESEPSASDESPFAGDFASELENAPSPEMDEGGQGEQAPGEEFGGGTGELDQGEPGGFGGGDEDFGFGDFGGGGGPGGGPGAPPSSESFDEESFESTIERLNIGIEGLDDMILGGVPKRSLIVGMGSAGTGKTTFGLQFLYEALQNDENAVFITLEESRESILNTADEKGWEFSRYEEEGSLAVVDLDPIEMANSLSSIQSELPELIQEFDAERLVLDSVSLLEMMYDNPARRRSEVFEFAKSLKDAGVTTFLTSEVSEQASYTSRYGIIEYLADAVFVLQYVRPSDFQETRLAVEIQKIRDANHSRETKPYEITDEGISVYRQANIF